MSQALQPALQLAGIDRAYDIGANRLEVFRDLNLTVHSGEITALVGPSGSGKSSLLHIAGLLEKPTRGEIYIAGRNCGVLDDRSRTRIRRLGIGFIYQFHHLLPEFTALENVVMPQLVAGSRRRAARQRAGQLLERLQISHRADHRPGELSGGEQQRVAIARALANRPLLLLADEPTGNLDPRTAEHVHGEFLRLIYEEGLAALIATHNLELARSMHRIVHLSDGQLLEQAPAQAASE